MCFADPVAGPDPVLPVCPAGLAGSQPSSSSGRHCAAALLSSRARQAHYTATA